jgi:hypothetical protein
MKASVLGPALALLTLAAAAPALAQSDDPYDEDGDTESEPIESEAFGPALTYTNASGGSVTFYGQFNFAYQSFDDGQETTDGIVDNGNWNSRLGFNGSQPLNNGTLRFRFETGLGLRNSAAISQLGKPDWIDWQRTALRWFEVSSETGIGRLSLGQGSSASDGTAGLDDSFTFQAGATDSSDGFGSFRFRDGDGTLTDVSVGQVNNSFDGARRFRLRYDTPDHAGFTFSTSWGRNVLTSGDDTDYYDVAVRWSGDLGDFALRSGLGYQWLDDPNGEDTRRLAGSVSAVHTPTGLNLAVSAGEQIDGASYVWTRAGWRTDYFRVGTTSLSVDYYNGRDFLSDGARTENWGIYAVQSFDAASIDLYAGWRRFTYSDRLGGSYQDADGVLVGARWFF